MLNKEKSKSIKFELYDDDEQLKIENYFNENRNKYFPDAADFISKLLLFNKERDNIGNFIENLVDDNFFEINILFLYKLIVQNACVAVFLSAEAYRLPTPQTLFALNYMHTKSAADF